MPILGTGCERAGAADKPPASLEGAWRGEGDFRASAGSMEVRAQLELLPGGEYRFLVLKPGLLAMAGPEQGTWAREGSNLKLTPPPPPAEEPSETSSDNPAGVFRKLRQGSSAAKRPPKTLTIADDLRDLQLQDGPMSLKFVFNKAATEKLRAAGEISAD